MAIRTNYECFSPLLSHKEYPLRITLIYYGVLLILVLPSLIHGRRATCHYLCWMAPFMVIGSSIGRFLHVPQLHVEASAADCISCNRCSKACPMGLDVAHMAKEGSNSKCTECILCGACVDECPKKVLKYCWRCK